MGKDELQACKVTWFEGKISDKFHSQDGTKIQSINESKSHIWETTASEKRPKELETWLSEANNHRLPREIQVLGIQTQHPALDSLAIAGF